MTEVYRVNLDFTWDLGQLPPIVAVMHNIKEQTKVLEASAYYSKNLSYFVKNSVWKDVLQSHANSSTEFSGNFPNSFNDYTDFKFGREFHKLYQDYTHNFNRHRAIPITTLLDGPTIFGHTFGSVIRNSTFKESGPFSVSHPEVITSSFDDVVELYNAGPLFHASGTPSGVYVASSIQDSYIDRYELRNSGILNHIELCQTSATSKKNSFTIFRLNKSGKNVNKINMFLHDNTIIRQEHTDGLGRLIFDISKYLNTSAESYDVSNNFLTPEHNFNLSLKTLISDFPGEKFGGGSIGVWIHTKPELGKVWTYLPRGEWVQHSVTPSDISTNQLINDYAHIFRFPQIDRPFNDPNKFKCLNIKTKHDVLKNLGEEDFFDIGIDFNTKNKPILVPDSYFKSIAHQVHRLNQQYVIEIFPLVYNSDRCVFYHKLNLIDKTLNTWSKPLVYRESTAPISCAEDCNDLRVKLTRNQVLTILNYFNELAGANQSRFGYGSRQHSYTSGVYETSGGSRINYVLSPDWINNTKGSSNLIDLITFQN